MFLRCLLMSIFRWTWCLGLGSHKAKKKVDSYQVKLGWVTCVYRKVSSVKCTCCGSLVFLLMLHERRLVEERESVLTPWLFASSSKRTYRRIGAGLIPSSQWLLHSRRITHCCCNAVWKKADTMLQRHVQQKTFIFTYECLGWLVPCGSQLGSANQNWACLYFCSQLEDRPVAAGPGWPQ